GQDAGAALGNGLVPLAQAVGHFHAGDAELAGNLQAQELELFVDALAHGGLNVAAHVGLGELGGVVLVGGGQQAPADVGAGDADVGGLGDAGEHRGQVGPKRGVVADGGRDGHADRQ